VECPRIALKGAQVSGPLRYRPLCTALLRVPAMRRAKLGRNLCDCRILFEAGRQNGNPVKNVAFSVSGALINARI
jgi:hypothetical protein